MPTDDLARVIDHAALKADSGTRDIAAACQETLDHGFRGLCVPTGAVSQARRLLRDGDAHVIAVVSFPHGTCAPELKAHAAKHALEHGADEIDYVISIGAARDGDFRFVREEALSIVRAVHGRTVKAILEVGFLERDQIVQCALRLADAGVAFVKTCTGFGPGKATPEIVRLLASTVGDRAQVKASGGIRTREQAEALLEAGATVLGTSHGARF